MRYEGYGPGDSAVVVDVRADDPERMRAELRRTFASHGGRLGAAGSVGYLFKEVGLLEYSCGADCQALAQWAWGAGAEEVTVDARGSAQVLTDPLELVAVRASLAAAGYQPAKSGVTCRSAATVKLAGAAATQMQRLFRALESLEGIEAIYTNAEVAGEVVASV